MIRPLTLDDSEAIAAIYEHYVQNTVITFDTIAPDRIYMRQQLEVIIKDYPAYVCTNDDDRVVGYCYVHPWKARTAYNLTMETTIYLHPDYTGKGLGTRLMNTLIRACRDKGYHMLIACITYPNEASEHLHAQLGFVQVSHFHEVGFKFGQWLDVVDYELKL